MEWGSTQLMLTHALLLRKKDLSLYLSSEHGQALVSESSLVLPESDWPSPLRTCLMIKPDVEQKLRQKLVQGGLGSLILESDVATCSQGRKLIAGRFTVPHKAESDRPIIDGRPQNAIESRVTWATLPHGSLLCQLHLQPDKMLGGQVMMSVTSFIFYAGLGRRLEEMHLGVFLSRTLRNWKGTRP